MAADLLEAVSLVHEALSPLDPSDRKRVLASVDALLADFEPATVKAGLPSPESRDGTVETARPGKTQSPKARQRGGRRPPPDLTPTLHLIRDLPGLTLSELQRQTNLAASTLHGYLRKLEIEGSIRKEIPHGGRSPKYYPFQQS